MILTLQRRINELAREALGLNRALKDGTISVEQREELARRMDELARLRADDKTAGEYDDLLNWTEEPERKPITQRLGRASDDVERERFPLGSLCRDLAQGRSDTQAMERLQQMGVGSDGGVVVPTKTMTDVKEVVSGSTIVEPLATDISDGTDADIEQVMFKQGDAGVDGGVVVNAVSETGDIAQTSFKLTLFKMGAHGVAAYIPISNKLLNNAPYMESQCKNRLLRAWYNAKDRWFLMGDGNGKPKGLILSACRIKVQRETALLITWKDTINMMCSVIPEDFDGAYWIAHGSARRQIMTMKDDAGNSVYIRGNAAEKRLDSLHGLPIRYTFRVPTLGSVGDLSLVVPRYYNVRNGSGPYLSVNRSVQETNMRSLIILSAYCDGACEVEAPILADDGVTYISPVVVLE